MVVGLGAEVGIQLKMALGLKGRTASCRVGITNIGFWRRCNAAKLMSMIDASRIAEGLTLPAFRALRPAVSGTGTRLIRHHAPALSGTAPRLIRHLSRRFRHLTDCGQHKIWPPRREFSKTLLAKGGESLCFIHDFYQLFFFSTKHACLGDLQSR